MQEIFKNIPGYKGLYQVSNHGRVKSLARKGCIKDRILKPGTNKGGYSVVVLCNGFKKTHQVHKIVAITFLNHKPCGHKLVVDHKDFDRTNNHLSNLRLITPRENTNQKHLKSSSTYTGVCWDKARKKWLSAIKIEGKNKHLGYFIDELDASNAYQKELMKISYTK